MRKIDTQHWKRFPMTEVFEMKNTKSITAASLVPDSGTTPYVTSQEGDNGVQMYVDCPEEWLDEGGCIMIGGKTLTFSYQKQDFCSNDSHNIALYSRDASSKSENCQLFLISALRASLEQSYSWGDSISMKRIKDDSVMLPVTPAGNPDWDYMEQTMREVFAQQEHKLDELIALAASPGTLVDTSDWGEFRIGDLFDIVKGARLKMTDRVGGETPYVGASQFNNGITQYIGNDEHVHPGNVLTVCYNGPVGTTFYQPKPFWATDDVNVLYPKFSLTPESGLFIAPTIEAVVRNFVYIDKWKKEDMENAEIKLPLDDEGAPDWNLMEETMSVLLQQARSNLDILSETLTAETNEP